MSIKSPSGKANGSHALEFIAYPDAFTAEYTFLHAVPADLTFRAEQAFIKVCIFIKEAFTAVLACKHLSKS